MTTDGTDGVLDADGALAGAGAELDRVEASSDGLLDVDTGLRSVVDGLVRDVPDDPRLPWLRDAYEAVQYMLRVGHDEAEFEPYLLLADGTCAPPRLHDQPDEKVDRWLLLRSATTGPAWRSRLGHLVVASGRGVSGRDRVGLADDTASAYLQVPAGWGSGLDRA
ncbi:MAG: hypothetical protein JWP57_4064, partial [Spirosoma sp.]|nr:hypothetical protein [Spirosoma sp.]